MSATFEFLDVEIPCRGVCANDTDANAEGDGDRSVSEAGSSASHAASRSQDEDDERSQRTIRIRLTTAQAEFIEAFETAEPWARARRRDIVRAALLVGFRALMEDPQRLVRLLTGSESPFILALGGL